MYKKEILEQLQGDILHSKEELTDLKSDISNKMKSLNLDLSQNNGNIDCSILESIKDIYRSIERFKFDEKFNQIQQNAYWLYKQNANLTEELKINSQTIDSANNKGVEDLKKQLRLQKSEIREYEQKIDQELIIRSKLEEEIKMLKKSLKETSRTNYDFAIPCINATNNKETIL